MTSNLIPFSTISQTVENGKTVDLYLYQTVESKAQTLGIAEFASRLASEESGSSAATATAMSTSSAAETTAAETIINSSVRRIAPELIAATPATSVITQTPTASVITVTPSNDSISINISNTEENGDKVSNPVLIAGIVLGTIIGLVIVVVLLMHLSRRRRRHVIHHRVTTPIPLHDIGAARRALEEQSELPWPKPPKGGYFEPQKMFGGNEVPDEPVKGRKLSGETLC
ncbi:hypothetical protein MMC07_001085 [Pseudocyphellaria aurata]|nr:hypothetical protein [Pseudocyphellaria aurata]